MRITIYSYTAPVFTVYGSIKKIWEEEDDKLVDKYLIHTVFRTVMATLCFLGIDYCMLHSVHPHLLISYKG